MRGRTRAEVLACAGAPFREAQDGETRVMTYTNVRADEGDLRQCNLNVVLKSGIVEAVRYSGRQSHFQSNTCSAIISACR